MIKYIHSPKLSTLSAEVAHGNKWTVTSLLLLDRQGRKFFIFTKSIFFPLKKPVTTNRPKPTLFAVTCNHCQHIQLKEKSIVECCCSSLCSYAISSSVPRLQMDSYVHGFDDTYFNLVSWRNGIWMLPQALYLTWIKSSNNRTSTYFLALSSSSSRKVS